MSQALLAASKKGKEDERRLAEEERALDRELDEYSRLLQLIDGPDGGFVRLLRTGRECKKKPKNADGIYAVWAGLRVDWP